MVDINVLTVAWSMSAAACVMVALLHLLMWGKQRPNKIYLLSFVMALAAAVNAIYELMLMNVVSIDRYMSLQQEQNAVIGIMLVSMVWFIDLHLGTARRWLTLTITVIWTVSLIANFLSPGNLALSEINELKRFSTYWGDLYTVAYGVQNPWKWPTEAASLLIAIFTIDATIKAWRAGDRERALLVGGSITCFIVIGGIHTPLVDANIVATPFMISFAFLVIVLAFSYTLVNDAVKVPRITRELQSTRREMDRMMRENSLGELSSSLAHELNQPLAAILSNAQAAQRFVANDPPDIVELREILGDIVRDDKRAGEVICGLRRMFSQGEIRRELFSINAALNEVVRLMHSELEDHKVKLGVSLERNLPPVDAGRVEVQQVIMNLMLNAMQAIEHEDSNERWISIETGRSNGAVRVAIEDSGPGIAADKIDHIFESFFSTSTGGLGMGLAISRRIIENYGGRLRVENLQRGGARFWFTLSSVGNDEHG